MGALQNPSEYGSIWKELQLCSSPTPEGKSFHAPGQGSQGLVELSLKSLHTNFLQPLLIAERLSYLDLFLVCSNGVCFTSRILACSFFSNANLA